MNKRLLGTQSLVLKGANGNPGFKPIVDQQHIGLELMKELK